MRSIYLAGPISGAPLGVRQDQFRMAESYLKSRNKDHVVYNPMAHAPICAGDCKGQKERPGDEHSRWCYLKWDIILMLTHCDTVALLDGWEQSKGALKEVEIAKHCGLRVYSVWDNLL